MARALATLAQFQIRMLIEARCDKQTTLDRILGATIGSTEFSEKCRSSICRASNRNGGSKKETTASRFILVPIIHNNVQNNSLSNLFFSQFQTNCASVFKTKMLINAWVKIILFQMQLKISFTQSELIESVLPQAAQLGIHLFLFSQHTVRDAPP